ncbi:MAG: hypothetical protein FWF15_02065 [Oscillospiraceae bacterium]|nr:hypothetical protein [Oscillospiraceae bacterium]
MVIFISCEISDKIKNNLSKNFEIRFLPHFELLPEPVSAHADMLIYKLPCGKLLVHEEYYNLNENLFAGFDVIITNEPIGAKYPHDILLNALNLNGVVYGKNNYTSKHIKVDVNLNQGYARCSTCIVNDNAVIASDLNIARTLNAEVLLIRPGNINLRGYGYGFIGGASCNFEDKVYFFGDIKKHPDYEIINNFLKKHKTFPVSLSDEELYDYGSMIII